MKTVKSKARVKRVEIGSVECEIVFRSLAADGTETFELEVLTFFEQRGRSWVPRSADKMGGPTIVMRQRRELTRLEVLRWFVMNYLPDGLHKDFRPVTHPEKGGVQ